MDEQVGSLYVSTVLALPEGSWRLLRLPSELESGFGSLRTSGMAFGASVSPNDVHWAAPAKLIVPAVVPRTVEVELVLTPWSRDRLELAIEPRRRTPWWRARYLRAAQAILVELAREFELQGLLVESEGAQLRRST